MGLMAGIGRGRDAVRIADLKLGALFAAPGRRDRDGKGLGLSRREGIGVERCRFVPFLVIRRIRDRFIEEREVVLGFAVCRMFAFGVVRGIVCV
ncbi:hypothetical protein DYI37_04120 [Fulvimarina endophytica]|uniref:Uncharacterized protein n=1 Tax=Fulvimarina endophytica TaxID=2293836 RepID=A0A371X744_9HYPH|nr:hypothetical protein [Fulvimarina endophytica]RFC65059.1 hypothetical protein DYI37_04120 [Fulvimarina endophytica]